VRSALNISSLAAALSEATGAEALRDDRGGRDLRAAVCP
jgi:hypothetical protein